jgi:hypothetical protein
VSRTGQVSDLHTGPVGDGFQTHLELALREDSLVDADSTIREFVKLLEEISPAVRSLWDGATLRDFNIGVQPEQSRQCSRFRCRLRPSRQSHDSRHASSRRCRPQISNTSPGRSAAEPGVDLTALARHRLTPVSLDRR